MTRRPISDALIHEALVLDAGGPLPAGVLEAISDGIRRTRQDRPLLARLGVVSGLVGARPERGSQDRSRTWALVMVGALLALVVGMLIVGGGSGPGPLPSATTESPAASADATPTASLVPLTGDIVIRIAPAADGGLWVAGTSGELDSPKVWRGTEAGGTWESVGAQSGFIRSIDILPDGRPIVTIDSGLKQRDNGVWVRGDDGVWDRVIDRESTVLHVARDGTAWMALYEGETPVLRAYRVDGGVWTELATVDRPAGGTLLDEGPDGSIWTAGINYGGSGGMARCTIAGCEVVLPRTAEIVDLAVAPDGRVAVVVGVPTDASPGLFDWRTDELIEGSWMTVREHTWPTEIAYTPDGSLWAFGDDGSLERRDETGAWITKVSSGLPSMFSLTVGPDGRIWWADREAAPGDQLRHLDPTE